MYERYDDQGNEERPNAQEGDLAPVASLDLDCPESSGDATHGNQAYDGRAEGCPRRGSLAALLRWSWKAHARKMIGVAPLNDRKRLSAQYLTDIGSARWAGPQCVTAGIEAGSTAFYTALSGGIPAVAGVQSSAETV